MKVVVKQFRSFMWGGSRLAIEVNLLRDKKILGDRAQIAEGIFLVVSIIGEYV